jgi:hypothetical protein
MPSAFESIETASPSSGTASVTFSNLQSTTAYDHFLLSCYFSPTTTPTSANVLIRLNGDTGANYNYLRTMVNSSAQITFDANQNMEHFDIADVGNNENSALVWIIGARTGEYKNMYSLGGPQAAQRSKFNFGQYRSGTNITSITFFLGDARLMTSNTRIALYGIKGA